MPFWGGLVGWPLSCHVTHDVNSALVLATLEKKGALAFIVD